MTNVTIVGPIWVLLETKVVSNEVLKGTKTKKCENLPTTACSGRIFTIQIKGFYFTQNLVYLIRTSISFIMSLKSLGSIIKPFL